MKPSKLVFALTFPIDRGHTRLHMSTHTRTCATYTLEWTLRAYFALMRKRRLFYWPPQPRLSFAQCDVHMGTTGTTVLPLTYTMLYRLSVGSLEVTCAAHVSFRVTLPQSAKRATAGAEWNIQLYHSGRFLPPVSDKRVLCRIARYDVANVPLR